MGERRGLGCCCFHQSGKAVNLALSTSRFMANIDGCLVTGWNVAILRTYVLGMMTSCNRCAHKDIKYNV